MSLADRIVAFVKVVSSALVGGEPVYNVTTGGGFRLDATGTVLGEDDSDDAGEQAPGQIGYSSLGIIGRPLPAERDVFAEALALRIDGGLTPYAWRDQRLFRAINPGGSNGTPAPGQLLFAGYGGAFLSHAMTPADVGSARANISTWYVPYDFDGDGVPAKAHVIAIDPTPGNASISLVHADGVFVTLTEDAGGGSPGITWAVDAATFGAMRPGEFTVQAEKIMLKGNVYLGRVPETVPVPLLPGVASQGCPSLYLSLV